jgi:hypothetical protein
MTGETGSPVPLTAYVISHSGAAPAAVCLTNPLQHRQPLGFLREGQRMRKMASQKTGPIDLKEM